MISRGAISSGRRLACWSNKRHVQSFAVPSFTSAASVLSGRTHQLSFSSSQSQQYSMQSTLMGAPEIRCLSSMRLIAAPVSAPHLHSKLLHIRSPIITRNLTNSSKKNNAIPDRLNDAFNNTKKALREIHQSVKTHLSLDIWTINIILLAFIVGPAVYNSMKNSTNANDDIPVDDPVEHSVRILIESTGKLDSNEAIKESLVTIISPEEDAKRVLNELLASDNIRNKASKIASGVIQSPPFQNAVYKLVKSIWDDLVNDPETTSQLTTLVYTVLQNEKVYSAVKDLLLQLVNDEEVYRELTKLVVKLGEEREVLDATQQLLTESAHRTLNDPNVLDHSMEFATEVVGDDVVQRTGGEALRNTVGYAVQPSGGAVLMGIGTMIVAGCLHFYFSRRGGGGSDVSTIGSGYHSPTKGPPDITVITSNPQISPQTLDISPSNGSLVEGASFGDNSASHNDNPAIASIFIRFIDALQKMVHFPVLLVGTIQSFSANIIAFPAYVSEKTSAGWGVICNKIMESMELIFSIPSQLGSFASSVSVLISGKASAVFCGCKVGITNILQLIFSSVSNIADYIKGSWEQLLTMVTEYLHRMRGKGGISPTL